VVYHNGVLEYLSIPGDRELYDAEEQRFDYEFYLTDHLGNTRVAFQPKWNGEHIAGATLLAETQTRMIMMNGCTG